MLPSGGDVGWLSLGACWWAACPAAPCSLTRRALADCSITKFLNRILGLEVDKQNMLFQYFSDTFDYLIEKDKKEGKYDMGILGTEKEGWLDLSLLLPVLTDGCSRAISGTVVSPRSTDLETPAGREEVREDVSYSSLFSYRFSSRSG